jgi:hypothetical protein
MLRRIWILVALVLVIANPVNAALEPVENFAKASLIQGYSAAVTTMVVTSGQGARFPSTVPFRVTIYECSTYPSAVDDLNREILFVTNRTGDSFTVTRGQENTTAKDHNTSGKTYCLEQSLTKAMWESIQDAIDDGAGGPQDIANMIAADLQASLAAANALAADKTLRITNTQTASADITFAASTSLWIPCGGKIEWTNGLNVNFDRPSQIQAGDCQIFEAKAGVHFTNGGKINPKWWGASASALASTNQTAIEQAILSLPSGDDIQSVLPLTELYQVTGTLLTQNRNFDVLCNDHGGGLILTTSASNRDLFRWTGTTKRQTVDGCYLKTSSTIVTDLGMKAWTVDRGNAISAMPVGSIFVFTHNKVEGFNFGPYIDCGIESSSTFYCDSFIAEYNVIKTGGSGGSSAVNEGINLLRLNNAIVRHNILNGDGKSEHCLYALHPRNIDFSGNECYGYVNEAIKLKTLSTYSGHVNPKNWTLDHNDLHDNEGSILVEVNQGYVLPLLSARSAVIRDDNGSRGSSTAVLIQAIDTAIIREINLDGLQITNAAKSGVLINAGASAKIDRADIHNAQMYNWSTSSAGTYAAIHSNSTGTKRTISVSGHFDGNSNGRGIFGVDFEDYWTFVQAGDAEAVNTFFIDDTRWFMHVGRSVSRIPLVGKHYQSAAQVATAANTTETTLATVTIKAQSLTVIENGFKIKAWGTFAANANTKTLRVKFGSTTLIQNDKTTAPNGVDWMVEVYILYRSNNVMSVSAQMQVDCVNQTPNSVVVGEDDDTDLDFKITGQNGTASANDITKEGIVALHLS